ncbi:interleukin 15, like isoform X2 [Etheostoma cragini]|uniref:interleukin 15, like isoform X2 n=1 Tax=Etheostoma cragini TaxID=417921 RepID=UPI00155DE366|nr:interleukin 15, like isoform X2 [Etheostoma cragini]
MLRGRFGLAIVYLVFVCLSGMMPPTAAKPCSLDTLKKVQNLISIAPGMNQKLNCSLYTPTPQDYMKCPKSTLKCFADETQVLIQEWESVNVGNLRGSRYVYKKLEFLSTELEQPESECLQCEFLHEENAEKFLEQLKSTLMMMNSQHC